MIKEYEKLSFFVDINQINGNTYNAQFPTKSKYYGSSVVIDLEKCNVDNNIENLLYYRDKFYKTLPVVTNDGRTLELTLAEIADELEDDLTKVFRDK